MSALPARWGTAIAVETIRGVPYRMYTDRPRRIEDLLVFADRWGARPVAIVSALIYASGLVLMIYSGQLPGALEISGFLIGVGTAGCGLGTLVGTVSRMTPPETRIQTVGLVSAAGSLS